MVRALLLAAIPLSFAAMSLACTGLAARGCTPFCTAVKLVWTPLLAAGCAVYFFRARKRLLAAIGLMSLVPLAPHCICYNLVNAWWVDHIGASPSCYVAGSLVSLIAVSALRGSARPWASLLACYAIVGGATAFFVGHHYFRLPW